MLLFHLEDPPVKALVDWNSYEGMMTEIAHHFAIDRDDLVDVYEVAVTPPDLVDEAAVTVVHVQNDIPVGSSQKLVLLDAQYHAHRSEPHFRGGPTVVRKVVPIPAVASRDELLYKAQVDRYCRSENGRCLVFINTRRWPDYDLDRKTIAHGDYIRIAVPPSDRFSCPTESIADMTQRGLSDQQIYDEIYNEDAVSGVSPSLLDDSEIRDLLADSVDLYDETQLMQRRQTARRRLSIKVITMTAAMLPTRVFLRIGTSICRGWCRGMWINCQMMIRLRLCSPFTLGLLTIKLQQAVVIQGLPTLEMIRQVGNRN